MLGSGEVTRSCTVPAAGDGFYLSVRPLPPGEHTIHVRAVFGADAIDVTYLLTVA